MNNNECIFYFKILLLPEYVVSASKSYTNFKVDTRVIQVSAFLHILIKLNPIFLVPSFSLKLVYASYMFFHYQNSLLLTLCLQQR